MTEERPPYDSGPPIYESLPPGASAKACPHCRHLLYWSSVHRPEVHFDTRTGFVSHVELERICLQCHYVETGFVNIDKEPVWTEVVQEETDEDEEKGRGRLAAKWLTAGLEEIHCQVTPIDWGQAGWQAVVTVDGIQVGTLREVYGKFHEDDFVSWLHIQLEKGKA